MSAFGDLLKQRREALGLTRDAFAARAAMSMDYLTDIEIRGKTPSVEKLFDIIRIASCHDATQVQSADVEKEQPEWSEVDNRVFMDMILATKGLVAHQLLLSAHADFAREMEEQQGEVWILSDILGEAVDGSIAKKTAENIAQRGMSYRYFVPFSSRRTHWETAIEQIEDALGESHKDLLSKRVRVYQVSDLAFTSRMRIAQPGSERVQGRYSIGGTSGERAEFVSAPQNLMERVATLLGELCNKADSGRPSSDPTIGTVERVFPPLKSGTVRKRAEKP